MCHLMRVITVTHRHPQHKGYHTLEAAGARLPTIKARQEVNKYNVKQGILLDHIMQRYLRN